MNIDNQSLASLARTARGVGVEELREALEGRGSMSNTNLAPTVHSMSTDADHKSHRTRREVDLSKVALTAASKQRKTAKSSPADVADVLNRLGIGKQNSSKMLHAPLQTASKKKQDNTRYDKSFGTDQREIWTDAIVAVVTAKSSFRRTPLELSSFLFYRGFTFTFIHCIIYVI